MPHEHLDHVPRPTSAVDDLLLTIKEAAERYHCTMQMMYELMTDGVLERFVKPADPRAYVSDYQVRTYLTSEEPTPA